MNTNLPTATRRARVLFFAEGATLAHVLRSFTLACAVARHGDEVVLATAMRYARWLTPRPRGLTLVPLDSLDTDEFLARVARGRPVFDERTLRRYFAEDLRLIDDHRPDVVIGDLRLSLAASARRAGVTYIALSNACWAPTAARRYPLPEIGWDRVVGLTAARWLFDRTAPMAMALHARPVNRLMAWAGIEPPGHDLHRVYTEADHTLYLDLPSLFPIPAPAPRHGFLGPVLCSLRAPLPMWWNDLPDDRPVVYWNLGSSGPVDLLARATEALGDGNFTVVAATLGRPAPARLPKNFYVAPYLPSGDVSARASAVVCNGGNGAVYLALAAGAPVIGIASNLDQFLIMDYVERAGAGKTLRAGRLTAHGLRAAVEQAVASDRYRLATRRLAAEIGASDAAGNLVRFIDELRAPVARVGELAGGA